MSDKKDCDETEFDDCSTTSPNLLDEDYDDSETMTFESVSQPNSSQLRFSELSTMRPYCSNPSTTTSECQLGLNKFSTYECLATTDSSQDYLSNSQQLLAATVGKSKSSTNAFGDEFLFNLAGSQTPEKATATQSHLYSTMSDVNFDEEFLITPTKKSKELDDDKTNLLTTQLVRRQLDSEWANTQSKSTISLPVNNLHKKVKIDDDEWAETILKSTKASKSQQTANISKNSPKVSSAQTAPTLSKAVPQRACAGKTLTKLKQILTNQNSDSSDSEFVYEEEYLPIEKDHNKHDGVTNGVECSSDRSNSTDDSDDSESTSKRDSKATCKRQQRQPSHNVAKAVSQSKSPTKSSSTNKRSLPTRQSFSSESESDCDSELNFTENNVRRDLLVVKEVKHRRALNRTDESELESQPNKISTQNANKQQPSTSSNIKNSPMRKTRLSTPDEDFGNNSISADSEAEFSGGEFEQNASEDDEILADPIQVAGTTLLHRSKRLWTETLPPPITFPFTAQPGITVAIKPTKTEPIDFFNLFFGKSLLQFIAEETNNYAQMKIGKRMAKGNITPRSRCLNWVELTPAEIKTFLGIWLHMGLIKKPRLNDYWTRDSIMSTPIFGEIMRRDRFLAIMSHLNFNDTETDDGTDPLHQLRPVLDNLIKKFQSAYYPEKQLAISQSTIPFCGKTKDFRLKLYSLADRSGYVLNLIPYCRAMRDDLKVGQKGAVVALLVENYLGVGHSLYCDDCCNTVALCEELLKRQTFLTGILTDIKNDFPAEFVGNKSKKLTLPGELLCKYCEGICVCKFRSDRREIAMISSEFTSQLVDSSDRIDRETRMPNCIQQYKTFMAGLDKCDQSLSNYVGLRNKWHKKLFLQLLNMSVHNAMVLYQQYHDTTVNSTDFRIDLIRGIYGRRKTENSQPVVLPIAKRRPGRPRVPGHSATLIPAGESDSRSSQYPSKLCKYPHHGERKRVRSGYMCPDCVGQPALCIAKKSVVGPSCFDKWHSENLTLEND